MNREIGRGEGESRTVCFCFCFDCEGGELGDLGGGEVVLRFVCHGGEGGMGSMKSDRVVEG